MADTSDNFHSAPKFTVLPQSGKTRGGSNRAISFISGLIFLCSLSMKKKRPPLPLLARGGGAHSYPLDPSLHIKHSQNRPLPTVMMMRDSARRSDKHTAGQSVAAFVSHTSPSHSLRPPSLQRTHPTKRVKKPATPHEHTHIRRESRVSTQSIDPTRPIYCFPGFLRRLRFTLLVGFLAESGPGAGLAALGAEDGLDAGEGEEAAGCVCVCVCEDTNVQDETDTRVAILITFNTLVTFFLSAVLLRWQRF